MGKNFDPSIYNIQDMINGVAKDYIPDETEDTLALGVIGYLQDIASLQIQNDIILTGELGNELWPSRAKYEKNVIAHSIIQNIVDINAKPATMRAYLYFEEEKIKPLFTLDKFTVDKECIFKIGEFDFHLEYDLIITRKVISTNNYVYSAMYDISRKNNLSKIKNPYTQTPFHQIEQGKRMLVIPCQLMQVSHETVYKKIISSSSIDNKTFEFTFNNQLADFEVCVKERGITTYLTPIFDGAGIENGVDKYCYYTYIDSRTIRVRFDSMSYLPTLNADVEVYIKTTLGEAGNFEFQDSLYIPLSSDRFNYKNLNTILNTAKDSSGGEDRKSVEELRRLLPKEALSRGSITTMQDLRNYFNTMILDSKKTRIEIMKKISNDFEKRSYYAYLVLKDEFDNVVPSNTIAIEVPKSKFDTHDNRKYVLKPGCYVVYEDGKGVIYKEANSKLEELLKDDTKNFIYTVPFMVVVTGDPLYVSYYLTIMNYPVYLNFDYINQDAPVQFISTYINWTRKLLTEKDTYILNMELTQNMSDGRELVSVDSQGNIIESHVKIFAVFYNDDSTEPYRYAIGEVVGIDKETRFIQVQIKLKTTDQINDDNKIRVEGVYIPTTTAKEYGYFTAHTSLKIYTMCEFEEDDYGCYDLNNVVPTELTDGWSVTNMYTVEGGVNFYFNYSQVMSSHVTDTIVENEYGDETGFCINSVPLIKHSYMMDEHNVQALIDQFNYEKAYIDNATYLLENNFLIDFKLFNTYGPSTMYSLDRYGKQLIDRVHLTLNFEVRLMKTSDNNTRDYILKDIKDMVEDLNDLDSLHITNLTTKIENDYKNSIEYIDFLGFNDYGCGYNHLYKQEKYGIYDVPEFLCVNVKDMQPDINIRLV